MVRMPVDQSEELGLRSAGFSLLFHLPTCHFGDWIPCFEPRPYPLLELRRWHRRSNGTFGGRRAKQLLCESQVLKGRHSVKLWHFVHFETVCVVLTAEFGGRPWVSRVSLVSLGNSRVPPPVQASMGTNRTDQPRTWMACPF